MYREMILQIVLMLGFPFDINCVLFQLDENKNFRTGRNGNGNK